MDARCDNARPSQTSIHHDQHLVVGVWYAGDAGPRREYGEH